MTRDELEQALSDRMSVYFGCVGDSVDTTALADVVADLIGKELDELAQTFELAQTTTPGSRKHGTLAGRRQAYDKVVGVLRRRALHYRLGQ
jgi:ribosomal protein L12E/L44/L45/RPP1/RPP2